jgi:hypothetical protein
MLFSACTTPTFGPNLVNPSTYSTTTTYPGNYLEGTTVTTACATGYSASYNTTLPLLTSVVYTCLSNGTWEFGGLGCSGTLLANGNIPLNVLETSCMTTTPVSWPSSPYAAATVAGMVSWPTGTIVVGSIAKLSSCTAVCGTPYSPYNAVNVYTGLNYTTATCLSTGYWSVPAGFMWRECRCSARCA